MRIKKGERWYGGIVFTIVIGLLIGIIFREKGFVFTGQNGETKELSKSRSAFIVLLNIIPIAGFGLMLRFWLLKTNDFICKYCGKEFSIGFETEKEVCKNCYEKRRH